MVITTAGGLSNIAIQLTGTELMLNLYVKAREAFYHVRDDRSGVVSFEYVVVAACIVGVVALAFGGGSNSLIYQALSSAISSISSKVTSAVS